MRKITLLFSGLFLAFSTLFANDNDDSTKLVMAMLKRMDSIESTLHYKSGKLSLGNGSVSINVPSNFKFLEAADAKYVVEDLWGNPPSQQPPLGLLMPVSTSATAYGGYAFIISFEEMGYVKDGDAKDIKYDELLEEMKKSSVQENLERTKLGLTPMNLIGWAAKPYYDTDKKILHWAKEYQIPGQDVNTLNYDIRVLGRKGVLVLQAVATMDELDSVNAHINDVIGMTSYTEGNRYSDFDSSTDNVAAWTIGGLVAGKVLAKVGFFAVILKFLKFIIAGIVLAGGAIWRFITGRKKKQEEEQYIPQPEPVLENRDTPLPPVE